MIINGEKVNFDFDVTVTKLLKEFNLSEDKVVVEINKQIIPKDNYKERMVNEQDSVEIISFVKGG